jgi:WD40 repeat protein
LADVFISYSRADTEYVRRLQAELQSRGKDVWVDVEGIRDAELFPSALRRAIEGSDAFVFVISPEAVHSAFCEQEVTHASDLNKRIVPLALRDVPDEELPDEIRFRNWIPAEDDGAVERLLAALETDIEWEHQHTRITVKALEWDQAGRDRSFLLRGADLAAAEQWLAAGGGRDPGPSTLEQEYLLAARNAARRRQRGLVGASLAVAAISIGLLIFALISRSQAISARNLARHQALLAKSRALAAESETQLSIDPERSVLLAASAVRTAPTTDAMFALRAALDASPIRFRLPDAGVQQCAGGFGPNGIGVGSPGLAFSADGREIAEGLCNGRVVIANARTGTIIRRIALGAPAMQLAFDPRGVWLGVAAGNRLILIDPRTGAIRRGPRVFADTRPAFDSSGRVMVVAGRAGVTVWNVRTGALHVLRPPPGVQSLPSALALSPDGREIAVGLQPSDPAQPGLLVGDIASGRVLARAPAAAADIAFSPDGRELAVAESPVQGSTGNVVIRDARTLALRRTLVRLPDVQTSAVAFSPDGTRVAYGAADGTAALVSAASGQTIVSYLGQTAAISQVAFSPDGTLVGTASSDGTLRMWRAGGVQLSATSVPNVVDLRVGQDDFVTLQLGPRGAVAQRWSLTGRPAEAPLVLHRNLAANAVFLGPEGRLAGVIVGQPPARAPVQIWNVKQRREIATVPPSLAPQGGEPIISPDGRTLAMAKLMSPRDPGTSFTLVDARTGHTEDLGTTACSAGWRGYAFDESSTLVSAGSFCGEAYVWNVATGRRVGRPVALGGELAAIAFSPDRRRLAIASWNSTVKVADVATGRVIGTLTGHTRGVPMIAYSPNGRYLASASLDHTVRVWDARTLTLLRVITHPDPVFGVQFTSDSREIVTFDAAGIARVWDACTACEDPKALLALASTRTTRPLTAQERKTFGLS